MNPNRKTRRELGTRAQPAGDLVATRPPASPYVFVGIINGGCVRLRPADVRAFVLSLLELVDQAEALEPAEGCVPGTHLDCRERVEPMNDPTPRKDPAA